MNIHSFNHLLEVLLNTRIGNLLSITSLFVSCRSIGIKPNDNSVGIADSVAFSTNSILSTRLLLSSFFLGVLIIFEIVGLLPCDLMRINVIASVSIGNVSWTLRILRAQQLIPFAVICIGWPYIQSLHRLNAHVKLSLHPFFCWLGHVHRFKVLLLLGQGARPCFLLLFNLFGRSFYQELEFLSQTHKWHFDLYHD